MTGNGCVISGTGKDGSDSLENQLLDCWRRSEVCDAALSLMEEKSSLALLFVLLFRLAVLLLLVMDECCNERGAKKANCFRLPIRSYVPY